MRSPVEWRADALGLGIVLTFSSFLLTVISGADNRFCAAAFCCSGSRRRCLAFSGFAIPRRHCSPASPMLGCQAKCLDDQSLGRFLSLFHFPDFLLGRDGFSICSDWDVFWRQRWVTRLDNDSLGELTGRALLHSEPLARASRHAGNRSTLCLRLVACDAFRRRCFRRSTLVHDCFRNGAFPGSRCRVNRLLPRLLYWSAP